MNIASLFIKEAKLNPEKKAVILPHFSNKHQNYSYSSITFKELDTMSNQFAIQLKKLGFKKGDKTLLFLRPSIEFQAMTFAIFKLGVIPVFIDPGMGKKNLLKCIDEIKPIGLIAEKEVHYISYFFPKIFQSIKIRITGPGKILPIPKITSIDDLKKEKILYFNIEEIEDTEMAAILFTSGGTGRPKGVVYTHRTFLKQTETLKTIFHLNHLDIDMPGFPLFSLFTISMGLTSVIPDLDPSKPSKCNPEKLYQNIIDQSPSFVAGSPAIWEKVADYCIENKLTLPSIKYLVMFGAPVGFKIHRKFKTILTNGTTYTPYGATEALPVSNVSGEYILKNTASLSEKGHGTCIGRPVESMQVKIIKVTDEPISYLLPTHEMPTYSAGEIIVKGDVVTLEYFNLPEKTHEAKIRDDKDGIWHRMGDLGYLDDKGLLWFLGRKAHRVETLIEKHYPIPCEAIFNLHPQVKRSALIGLGNLGEQIPAIVIERKDGEYLQGKDRSIFESELLALAKKYPHTESIQKIYFSKSFPVDVRHNIKIDRKKLKEEIEHNELK